MYVSKSEPERLKYAMHDTLQNMPPDASQRKRLSMIGATVLTHRQVSLQEAVYRLGGFPLIRSTRTTITVILKTGAKSLNPPKNWNNSQILPPKSLSLVSLNTIRTGRMEMNGMQCPLPHLLPITMSLGKTLHYLSSRHLKNGSESVKNQLA